MELLKSNYVNTTTGFTVQSNTITAGYLLIPDLTFQYVSSGYANDLTQTSIRFGFLETLTVSRIALMGMNFREFNLFYNDATANTFALTSTGATVTSQWVSNSESSIYLTCTPVACTSITLDIKKTQIANVEKAIGYFMAGQELIDFPIIPSARNYKFDVDKKAVRHTMSDGTVRIHSVFKRMKADIGLKYISLSFRNTLKTVYDRMDGMVFVPFGTTTSWDAILFPCVWDGQFDFYEHSDDASGSGFSGKVRLLETTP